MLGGEFLGAPGVARGCGERDSQGPRLVKKIYFFYTKFFKNFIPRSV
jgi:hypothetical protein